MDAVTLKELIGYSQQVWSATFVEYMIGHMYNNNLTDDAMLSPKSNRGQNRKGGQVGVGGGGVAG